MPEAVGTKSSTAKQPQSKQRGPAKLHPRVQGSASSYADVMALHRTAGNRAVVSLMEPHVDQATLPAVVTDAIQTPGQPLDPETREFMEGRFGRDFSTVRVHADATSGAAASVLDAGAYTVGSDVVFGHGFYRPETPGGRVILAHELAHVIQQSKSGSRTAAVADQEREAGAAQEAVFDPLALPRVNYSAEVGVACLTVGEARSWLFSRLPPKVQEVARPYAEVAARTMDKVIPPTTEIPKPVEAAVTQTVEAVTTAVEHPEQVVKKVEDKVVAAKPAIAKATQKIGHELKQAVGGKTRDFAIETVGEVKGVVLEATNIVDTLAWIPYEEHELLNKLKGHGELGDAIAAYADFTYAPLEYAAKQFGLSETDPLTGKPTRQFAISGAVSKKLDEGAESLEGVFGDLPKEQALVFTSYEQGELKGAIVSQGALALVGVEEVQLVLKGIGAIGAVKGIVETVQRNPEGWSKDPQFWAGILNAVLSVIGLKQARAGRKLINMVLASGSMLNAVPAIWQLYNDYSDPNLTGPDRDKRLKADLGNILKILANAALEIVRHGGAKAKGTEQGTGAKPGSTETTTASSFQEGTATAGTARTGTGEPPVTTGSPEMKTAAPIRTGGVDLPTTIAGTASAGAPRTTVQTAGGEGEGGTVTPITAAKRGSAGSPTLKPGQREVSSLDEFRARRGAAKQTEPLESEHELQTVVEQRTGDASTQEKSEATAKSTARRWDDPTLSEDELLQQYKKSVKSPMPDESVRQKLRNGLRFDPDSHHWKRPTTPKPDVRNQFKFSPPVERGGKVYKVAEGQLGVPGEVQTHRSSAAQRRVSGGTGDDAGHMIGNRFGAPGGEENLSPQNWKANEYGTFKKLENKWARLLKAGWKIEVKVTDVTNVGEDRPYKRMVSWTGTGPDGSVTQEDVTFANMHTQRSRTMRGIKPTVSTEQTGNVIDLAAERRRRHVPSP